MCWRIGSLQAMERAAEASGGSGAPQLQFHNLVNNADVVPRLLGTSLEALHDLLETYIPMIQVPGSALSLPQYMLAAYTKCMFMFRIHIDDMALALCACHESSDGVAGPMLDLFPHSAFQRASE